MSKEKINSNEESDSRVFTRDEIWKIKLFTTARIIVNIKKSLNLTTSKAIEVTGAPFWLVFDLKYLVNELENWESFIPYILENSKVTSLIKDKLTEQTNKPENLKDYLSKEITTDYLIKDIAIHTYENAMDAVVERKIRQISFLDRNPEDATEATNTSYDFMQEIINKEYWEYLSPIEDPTYHREAEKFRSSIYPEILEEAKDELNNVVNQLLDQSLVTK